MTARRRDVRQIATEGAKDEDESDRDEVLPRVRARDCQPGGGRVEYVDVAQQAVGEYRCGAHCLINTQAELAMLPRVTVTLNGDFGKNMWGGDIERYIAA